MLESYDRDIIELFWEAGVDYTEDKVLATYLGCSGSNRPLYGWVRHHRDDPRIALAMAQALVLALVEDHVRAACLLLWAGADPHRRLPPEDPEDEENEDDPQTALENAVWYGKGKYLRKIMRIDPERDNLERLVRFVSDGDAVDALMAVWPGREWSQAIVNNILQMSYSFDEWDQQSLRSLERIAFHGGRLNRLDVEEIGSLRRNMRMIRSGYDLCRVVELLADEEFCDPLIFQELMRTGSIQNRMAKVGAWMPRKLMKILESLESSRTKGCSRKSGK